MIVDANIAAYWVAPTPLSKAARPIAYRADLIAPDLLPFEAARALISFLKAGRISRDQLDEGMTVIASAFVDLPDSRSLLAPAIDLSIQHGHVVYDCLYLALALERREPFATADKRLAALAGRLGIETLLIEPE